MSSGEAENSVCSGKEGLNVAKFTVQQGDVAESNRVLESKLEILLCPMGRQ